MSENTVQMKEQELLAIIDKNRALDATYKLIEIVLESTEFEDMTQKIADIIPKAMGYEFGFLSLVDYENQKLEKVAISKTITDPEKYKLLTTPLVRWNISTGYTDNLCIKAIRERRQYISSNLYDFLKPRISKEQAEKIQHLLNAQTCIATPLMAHGNPIGVILVTMARKTGDIKEFEKEMLRKFSENAGIAVDNSKLYSNLKIAKNDLHKAYENLKVLNKMKDEFLTVASHELRTPMTIVKSYLWMLEKEKGGHLNKKQHEYLDKAISGTQRMIALINDMLDISKFEQNKLDFEKEQIDLCNLVEEVVENFELKAKEKKVKLIFEKENCVDKFVDADKQKVRDVLMNLIDNGIKFTEKGTVTITVDESDNFMRINISDTGTGINRDDLKKLFHKFGRIDNSYTIATESGGTGLGLYIVKLYIEGMGGKVGAESKGIGKGSTFWLTLPKNQIKKYTIAELAELRQEKIPTGDL